MTSVLSKKPSIVMWAVAAFGLGCGIVLLAQGRTDATDGGGSLAALTSEVKQLRVAVEESTRSQTQTQALGVYLSVQQSRVLDVATRLDSVRKELDAATARSRDIVSQLENVDAPLLRAGEPQERARLEDVTRNLKVEKQRWALQEQQARSREGDLSQTMQLEESRWSDLISRLEQAIKR